MQFKKFSSLENTYREKSIERIRNSEIAGKDFFVTEKIHGANFAFYWDGSEVRVASRNQFVDGGFYGCKEVVERVKPKFVKMCKTLMSTDLIMYGELCGKGVFGSPDYGEKQFRGFDLVVSGNAMNKDDAFELMLDAEIDVVPFIGVMELEEALAYNVERESNIGKGTMEGVVIEPLEPHWFGESRCYLKKKSTGFSEKKQKKIKDAEVDLSLSDTKKLGELSQYATEARVMSVISKIGEVGWSDFGKVSGLYVQDALAESEIDKDDFENWNRSRKVFIQECQSVVRSVLTKVL